MWIFTTVGFFSVVQKPGEEGVQVRARAAEDLDRLRANIITPLCPYRWVFEPPHPPDVSHLHSLRDVPRPFVVEPPLDDRTSYAAAARDGGSRWLAEGCGWAAHQAHCAGKWECVGGQARLLAGRTAWEALAGDAPASDGTGAERHPAAEKS